MTQTMHAMVLSDFGEPDVFQQTELPSPEVSPKHVLIRVEASSVNPVDTKIRQGKLSAIAPDRPTILHGDVAGTIEAIGAGVKGLAVGDEVFACAGGVKGRQGALADWPPWAATVEPTSLGQVISWAAPVWVGIGLHGATLISKS